MAGDFVMGTVTFDVTDFVFDPGGGNFYVAAAPAVGGLARITFDWTWSGDRSGGVGQYQLLLSPDPVIDLRDPATNDFPIGGGLIRTRFDPDQPFMGEQVTFYGNTLPFDRNRDSMGDGTYYMAVQVISTTASENSNLSNDISNVVAVTFSGGPSGSGPGGPTQPGAEVRTAFAANTDAANGLSAAYHVLLGGVPNEAGFVSLINSAVSTNFGAGPGPVFNTENIFINLINNLVQGNQTAKARFDAIATGTTLQEKITSIYQALVPPSKQTAEGLAFLTSAQNIAFYQGVAAERGVAGTDGAAIVAMASLLKIVVGENIGVGNAINDLAQAVAAGNAALPASGSTFTDIEVADGTAFDADDAAAIARMAAAAEPVPFAYVDDGGGPVSDHEGHNVQLSGAAAAAAGDGLFLT